ncbi:MAG: hypothetical protein ACREQX_05355, partial [Candidatus Binataceae bacterium]
MLGLLAMVASGCAHTPRGVAEHYLTALQQFNYGECYALLSIQDRHDRTLKEFLTEIPLAPAVTPELFRAILHDTRYALGRQHRTVNRAWVPLTVTTVDLPLWERTLDARAGADGSGADQAVRSLETGDYPKFTYVDQIVLVKEHHHWHVYANFAARDLAGDLRRQALEQYHQHQYRGAIATYQSLMAMLDKDDATGALGLAARYGREMKLVENVAAQLPQAMAYAPKLKLSHVAMKMSEEHRAAIFGQMTNTGAKAIDEVQVVVKWYVRKNKHLQMTFSEDHPVVATPIVFTSVADPVLPMAHNQTRNFGF